MEMISIQIPAKLYTSIYAAHEEDTTNAIYECLSKLVAPSATASAQSEGNTTHFMRPGPGTITGKVWEIADELLKTSGSAERDVVVKACMDAGININTASTQYSHWKNATIKT